MRFAIIDEADRMLVGDTQIHPDIVVWILLTDMQDMILKSCHDRVLPASQGHGFRTADQTDPG